MIIYKGDSDAPFNAFLRQSKLVSKIQSFSAILTLLKLWTLVTKESSPLLSKSKFDKDFKTAFKMINSKILGVIFFKGGSDVVISQAAVEIQSIKYRVHCLSQQIQSMKLSITCMPFGRT